MYVSFDIVHSVVLECNEECLSALGHNQALRRKLESQFVDRVVPKVGLCVAVADILTVEPMAILGPNDGRPCYKVKFHCVVFKPLPKEVIHAKILASDALGIKLTTGFFQDIRVPPHLLPEPSSFDAALRMWMWVVDDPNSLEKTNLYFEMNQICRFRVVDVVFSRAEQQRKGENKIEETVVPMLVVGSMKESGLGLDIWWSSA